MNNSVNLTYSGQVGLFINMPLHFITVLKAFKYLKANFVRLSAFCALVLQLHHCHMAMFYSSSDQESDLDHIL